MRKKEGRDRGFLRGWTRVCGQCRDSAMQGPPPLTKRNRTLETAKLHLSPRADRPPIADTPGFVVQASEASELCGVCAACSERRTPKSRCRLRPSTSSPGDTTALLGFLMACPPHALATPPSPPACHRNRPTPTHISLFPGRRTSCVLQPATACFPRYRTTMKDFRKCAETGFPLSRLQRDPREWGRVMHAWVPSEATGKD